MTATQTRDWIQRMEQVRKDDIAMQAHDDLMEEIRIENERMNARMDLYPDSVYGGDGVWSRGDFN